MGEGEEERGEPRDTGGNGEEECLEDSVNGDSGDVMPLLPYP